MTTLFETITIDSEVVKAVCLAKWGIELGSLIKASQNYTFNAKKKTGEQVIVRVTPDPRKEQRQRILVETTFLNYLAEKFPKLNTSPVVHALDKSPYAVEGDLVVVVSEFAKGAPVVWGDYKWLTDKVLVEAWGKWLGDFHVASKRFSKEHPEIASLVRPWTDLHLGVMKGAHVDPQDQKLVTDPDHYGILHGDLNVSNFFYESDAKLLHVFDWDQIQASWFLYDLAQGIFGAHRVARTEKAHAADEDRFMDWMVAGYETVESIGKVDKVALKRMVTLRKLFYYRFCRRGAIELEGDKEREALRLFCKSVTDWIESEGEFTPNS